MRPLPTVLVILDGFGCGEQNSGNAVFHAHTPNWDHLWQTYPHMELACAGPAVGLPEGQMGNSEVGHMHIGAGRVIEQDLVRVDRAMQSGEFRSHLRVKKMLTTLQETDNALHIFGLLSPGGVHSHEAHIFELIRMAADKGCHKIVLHAFLDGRDVAPRSAQSSLERCEALFTELGCGQLGSVSGRYYAMDRDLRWDRTKCVFELLTEGVADYQFRDAEAGLNAAYERGESDEFVKPTRLSDSSIVQDGDAIVFMNFRADRARQLTYAFLQEDFSGFERAQRPVLSNFFTLTEYHADYARHALYPSEVIPNVLGEVIAQHDLSQYRVAETEKYAHVTFFLNGGRETEFDREHRCLVPSPKVATYDLQPEMHASEVTDALEVAIQSGDYDFLVVNYANTDMVGHSGNLDAAKRAVECIDEMLGRLHLVVSKVGGHLFITADHGNVEQMHVEGGDKVHTAHTCNPVPFVYAGPGQWQLDNAYETPSLIDIAPTLLYVLGLPIPAEMTGKTRLVETT